MKPERRGLDLQLTLIFGIIALLIGIWSIPASLWEWDEILFSRGLHQYDVTDHSPHPPGFPLYIFAGRGARLLGVDDKTALCLVGLVFAFILGASAYRVFRELFEDRRTASVSTALLLAVPPVMIYLGAPRSDVPGMSAGLLALALALKGRTSSRALAAAGLALGLGFGIRVTILFAVAPVLVVVSLGYLVRRKIKPVLIAAGLALSGALLCYLPVVLDTGLSRYQSAMRDHTRYTSTIDTFLAGGLNSDWGYRLGRYFVDPWGTPLAAGLMALFSVAGIIFLLQRRRGRALGWMALAFLPIMLFTVLYMTPLAAALYALPFLPLFTGLAGAGLVPPRFKDASAHRGGLTPYLGWALAVAAIGASIVWTAPILQMRHREVSPSWQAVNRILESRDPAKSALHFDGNFLPFVSYVFADYRTIPFRMLPPRDFNLLDPEASLTPGTLLTLDPEAGRGGERFQWTNASASGHLKKLSLGRYFDVFLSELQVKRNFIRESGWYEEEKDGPLAWHWTSGRFETAVLALFGKMTLRLKAEINPYALKPGDEATIVIKLDDREIDRFRTAGGKFERSVAAETPAPGPWRKLTIETDRVVVPADLRLNEDRRELGLQVFDFRWEPAAASETLLYGLDSFVAGGWYAAEAAWRWAGAEALLKLPPVWLDGRLEVQMDVPAGEDGRRARVTVEINGQAIDSFDPPEGTFIRGYDVPLAVHGGKEALLRLATDRVVPTPQARNLGLRVFHAAWAPASAPFR